MHLRIALLGSLRVAVDNTEPTPVALGRRERAVLTLLALRRGQVVTTSRLIDELWPQQPPEGAANSVQVYVSRIRRALGADAIRTDAAGYALDVSAAGVDVSLFERLATAGSQELEQGRFAEAARILSEALALWELGGLVDGLELRSVQAEALRLDERRLTATEDRIDASLSLGRAHEVIAGLQALAAQHPFRERLHAGLMTALVHAGRQAEALEHYADYRARCVEELGMEPGPALQRTQAAILSGDAHLSHATPTSPMPAPITPRPTASLPRPMTRLVGREGEMAKLTDLLRTPGVRLVTLTGPGGSGKTRLATELGHGVVEVFYDGVYFVPLATVTTPDVMWTSISEVLNAPSEARVPPQLLEHVARLSALFVLDNLEQLPRADEVVAEILRAAPHASVVATSRSPLHLAGEHEHPVPPLDLPAGTDLEGASSSAAVQMFVQHAQMVRPAFALTGDNATTVAELCRRLDGLPLALELAAARTRILTPQALLARLDKALDIAAAGSRAPSRQRTLRDTIAWSYDLLEPKQRAFFRRLGVFSGGADLAAVAAVTADIQDGGEPIDLIGDLAGASLVSVTAATDGEPRVRLLELVRTYAVEELVRVGELDLARRAHADHYRRLAEALSTDSQGPGFHRAMTRAEVDLDNFRAALQWALPDTGPVDEERTRIGAALVSDLSWAYFGRGYLAEVTGWLQVAESYSTTASPELAACLALLGRAHFVQTDMEAAGSAAERSLDMLLLLGDERGALRALNVQAVVHIAQERWEAARESLGRSIELARRLGADRTLANALGNLANLETWTGNREASLEIRRRAVTIARRAGDPSVLANVEGNLVGDLVQMGLLDEAVEQARITVQRILAVDNPDYLLGYAENHAHLLFRLGDATPAARLLGATDAMRERRRFPRPPLDDRHVAGIRDLIRQALGDTWESEYGQGRDLDPAELMARHELRVRPVTPPAN